jgi:hypothetical protein
MINKISNIEELRAEKVRLQVKKAALEEAIKDDIHEIKESLNPMNLLKSKVHHIKNGENGMGNKLLGTSLSFGLDFLITRLLFKKSGFLKKTIMSLLIHNIGSKVLTNKSGSIISAVKEFIEKLRSEYKNKKYTYDRTTASDDY